LLVFSLTDGTLAFQSSHRNSLITHTLSDKAYTPDKFRVSSPLSDGQRSAVSGNHDNGNAKVTAKVELGLFGVSQFIRYLSGIHVVYVVILMRAVMHTHAVTQICQRKETIIMYRPVYVHVLSINKRSNQA
jgi:hypothetical protein